MTINITMKQQKPKLDATALTQLVTSILDDRKADDITLIDLHEKADYADAMIIASGTSARHVAALADHLVHGLKAAGFDTVPVEGLESCDWVLVDAGDVIIHLFRPEIRDYYRLEKMWAMPAAVAAQREPALA